MLMNNNLQRFLLAELRKIGCLTAFADPPSGSIYPIPGKDIRMTATEVRFSPDAPEADKELARGPITDIYRQTKEMWRAWEAGLPLAAHNGNEQFRILAETEGYVLAARDDGDLGLHFASWQYSQDKKDITLGKYTTSYPSAKQTFATRAGLVDKNRLIDPAEARMINEALKLTENAFGLKHGKEKTLDTIYRKLEHVMRSGQDMPCVAQHEAGGQAAPEPDADVPEPGPTLEM